MALPVVRGGKFEAKLIYIILVNWNSSSDLIECLESLARIEYSKYCVIVCDNGSTDGSLDALKAWSSGAATPPRESSAWKCMPNAEARPLSFVESSVEDKLGREPHSVYWLPIGRNAGFAAANNVGLNFAFADPSAEFAWLLNTDTIVDPSALSELVKRASEDGSLGLVGSTLCFYRDPQVVQALGATFSLTTFGGKEIFRGCSRSLLPDRNTVERQISYVVGASMLVSRDFFLSIGGMSEEYFLYYEEIDWAVRSSGRFNLGWAPDSIVYHKEGGSIGTNADSRPSNTSIYYMNVNMLRFCLRHRPWLLPLAFLRLCLRALRYILGKDAEALKTLLLAGSDWAFGRRRIGPASQFQG